MNTCVHTTCLEFQKDAPEIEKARIAAIEASMELQDLLTGPIQLLRPIVRPV